MKALWTEFLAGRRELALVAGVIAILVILFAPIPPQLLDVLLVLNLSTSLLILLITFYTVTPLNFSTFPSLLLIATLFRLALNISSTRLILEHGYAGEVIGAIGEQVVGGNYIVGFVVFLILVVVQYVVVTNGAQRVAEVAARFTLDSMPGKQMAIDADMNMGLIDEHEARRRRALIEKEANFYGAMDGATKFVKGDAIAGIVIILINIVGGLAVGMIQLGMGWTEAVQRFTLLTVGDGIVTQIPSLVIAVATGIIITRAATDAQLGREISRQVLGMPRTLGIVAFTLVLMLLMPGMPKWPVALVLAGTVALLVMALRKSAEDVAKDVAEAEATAQGPKAPPADDIQALLRIDPLELRLGRALLEALATPGLDVRERADALRRQFAQDWGVVLPKLQVSELMGAAGERYELWVQGHRAGHGELVPDGILAINPGGQRPKLDGRETRDPAFGLPALWITQDQRSFARGAGYTLVDAETVLMTHLGELFKRHAPELLTRAEVEKLVQRVRATQPSLVDELVPGVLSLSDIQKVLQQLLREQVSLRAMDTILEVLVDAGKGLKATDDLVERVRERLGAGICQRLADGQGELHVLTLAPEFERQLLTQLRASEGRGALINDLAQLDGFLKAMAKQADAMIARNLTPVVLAPAPLRRSLRQLVARSFPYVSVVGVNEVPTSTVVRTFGSLQPAAAAA